MKQNCEHEQIHEETVARAKATIPSEAELGKMCNIFRILGEPSRMKIVFSLLQGEMCVYHIVEAVGGNQSAVSHQLRVLKDNGIIKARRDGQNILYSIADEHVVAIVALSREHAHCDKAGGEKDEK